MPYIKRTGTKVTEGTIYIPAEMFAPHLSFGKAVVKSSAQSINLFSTSNQIEWYLEKHPMFRPVKR